MLSELYYIASNHPTKSHAELVKEACEADVNLIQLRMKEYSFAQVMETAKECKAICKRYNATLIINDYAEVAKQVGAAGIHLGKNDMNSVDARKFLGDKFIIGATANTIDDVEKLIESKVDYIGLGPFNFTETKKNLSPSLGLIGYQNIIEELDALNVEFPPIYAIGGIKLENIRKTLKTGVYGVAVSNLISTASNKKLMVKNMKSEIEWKS